MSLTDGLIQHFSPEGNTAGSGTIIFKDGTGAQYAWGGTNVTLVEDSFLGLSLGFSGMGSYLEIDHPELHYLEDFTIGGWFKLNVVSGWIRLLGKGNYADGDESIGLRAYPRSQTWWFSQQGTVPQGNLQSDAKEIAPDTWYHLTAVRQDDTLTLYYNTEILARQTGIRGNVSNPLPLRLGDSGTNAGFDGTNTGFNGQMTHLRIYNRALSASEVNQMITASEVATLVPAVTSGTGLPFGELPGSAFKRSHPVDFALFDRNNHYALYIDDSRALGQPLTFEAHNTSDRTIVFQNGEGSVASATNYHFELQFRPGVLSENTLLRLREAGRKEEIVTDPGNWDVFVPAASSADHVSLYILYRSAGDWPADTRRTLRFAGINADAGGGARGTQVAMLPNQLAFAGSDVPLTGRRTHHLSIINHRGEKTIPLHVGFVGSNQVLNVGGRETNLTLEIVNVLRLAQTHAETPFITLSAGNAEQPTSRLILEFDVEQEREKPWALARASELDGMTVTAQVIRGGESAADGSLGFHMVANTQSISRQIELTPARDITLTPGDSIRLHLNGIVTSLPTGPTNAYLHYDNIPGYQDGVFTLSVIKSPLLFAGGNVGIGTAAPVATLQIVSGNQDENGNTLILGPTYQANLRLGYNANYSWIQSHGAKPLAINTLGNNVGIKTNNPQATLHVAGDLRVDGNLQANGVPGFIAGPIKRQNEKWIQVDNLDLNTHRMYMMVVKLQNPFGHNFDWKLIVNDDRNEGNYHSVFTQQFGNENRVRSQQSATFANAGTNAQHNFTIYITKSTSGRIVAHGQGGFETPSTDAVWGYQLWNFYLAYKGTNNLNTITILAGGNGQVGPASEVSVVKWF